MSNQGKTASPLALVQLGGLIFFFFQDCLSQAPTLAMTMTFMSEAE